MFKILGKIFAFIVVWHSAQAHHDIENPWHMHFHEHGLFRPFFGGFFTTLLVIFGVLGFYYYFVRGSSLGKTFTLFPRKPIIPITIPFARAPNYVDPERPETILLTNASASPSVFYSNNSNSAGPWKGPHSVTIQNAYPGYTQI